MRTITYPGCVEAAVCFEVGCYVHTPVRTGTRVFLRCQTGSLGLWQCSLPFKILRWIDPSS
jgi:hypothetical protein